MQTIHFDNIVQELKNLIGDAKKSIRIASGFYTSEHLTNALCEASKRNVDIQLIVDKKFNGSLDILIKLADANGLVYIYGKPHHGHLAQMHNKFCVIDGHTVITGSFNWTNNAEKNNKENIIVVKSPKLAQKTLQEFIDLRESSYTEGIDENKELRKKERQKYDKDGGLDFSPLEIKNFSISNNKPKKDDEIKISWEVKGANILELHQGSGKRDVSHQQNPIEITANKSETLRLVAKNEYGESIEKTLSIDVEQLLYPSILEFKTNKGTASIKKGEQIIVSWRVENAIEVRLRNNDGFDKSVAFSGKMDFCIKSDTKFYLSAKNSDGNETEATLFANIYTPAPIINCFKSNKEYSCFLPNEEIIIYWSVENSHHFILHNDNTKEKYADLNNIGKKIFASIKQDTVFILEVFNASGDSIKNKLHISIAHLAEIKVSAPEFSIAQPPLVPFPVWPAFFNAGGIAQPIVKSVINLKANVDNLENATLKHLRLIHPLYDPRSECEIRLGKKNIEIQSENTNLKHENVKLKNDLAQKELQILQLKREVQRISQLEQQLKETQNRLTQSQQQLKETQNSLAQSQKELKAIQNNLTQSQQQLKETQNSLTQSQQQLKETQNRLSQKELEQQLKKVQSSLNTSKADNHEREPKNIESSIENQENEKKSKKYNELLIKILMVLCVLFFTIIIGLVLYLRSIVLQ